MNSSKFFFSIIILLISIISGCVTAPKNIPSSYFEKQHDIAVNVVRINEKPIFRDSGQGGLIGAVVAMGRSGTMKEMFEGIKGETVKELLRQEIENKLESTFVIDEESKDLSLEVNVVQWGWFLPTTALGIKTGSYQLEINGSARVFELTPIKKEIAVVNVLSQKPLGNDPTSEICQQALKEAIEDFARQVAASLLKEKRA